MRRYPYKLTVEDRDLVWNGCRRMLVGYLAVAIVLLLAALAFRVDHDSRDHKADEAPMRFDHFWVDDLAISLAPEAQAIHPQAVVGQNAPQTRAGLDPKHAR